MVVKYSINHILKNTPHNRRPGIAMKPKFLTIHSTANLNSTAFNERGWLTNTTNKNTASFHVVVDENEALEVIPLNETAWHAGDGNGQGNMASIGLEICESGDRQKTIQNAVKIAAKILSERGWETDRLRRHYDWSGKICPRILQENNWAGWNIFKQNVKKEMEGDVKVVDKNQPSDWAKESWEWAKTNGYMDGNRPKDGLTREEFSIVLKKIIDRFGHNNDSNV